MIKDQVRWIVGSTRPTHTPDGLEIPADWIIYNAPRPLRGALTWIGEFISGIFYAASPVEDRMAYETNLGLNAHQLRWSTDEQVKTFVNTVLVSEYPEIAGLDFNEHRRYFEDKFWCYYNYGDL